MKKLLFLVLSIYSFTLLAQENTTKKPEFVVIANNEIISKEKLEALGEQGLIKSMHKGVTQEERNKLAEKHGDKIGDKEFIIKISVLSEKEKLERGSQISELKDESTTKAKTTTNGLKLKVNDVAESFTVEMINGERVNLSDLKGKVVLLNYWATWCGPCLMEFTEFPEKILKPFKDKEFVLLAISRGETKEKVEQKMADMKKYGVTFNVGLDPKKEIWDRYATRGIPKNFLIDKNGIIKYISTGYSEVSVDELATEIKKLLTE